MSSITIYRGQGDGSFKPIGTYDLVECKVAKKKHSHIRKKLSKVK